MDFDMDSIGQLPLYELEKVIRHYQEHNDKKSLEKILVNLDKFLLYLLHTETKKLPYLLYYFEPQEFYHIAVESLLNAILTFKPKKETGKLPMYQLFGRIRSYLRAEFNKRKREIYFSQKTEWYCKARKNHKVKYEITGINEVLDNEEALADDNDEEESFVVEKQDVRANIVLPMKKLGKSQFTGLSEFANLYDKLDAEDLMSCPTLTSREKSYIKLKCLYGFERQEIAKRLGVTVYNCDNIFRNVKEKIRTWLNKE